MNETKKKVMMLLSWHLNIYNAVLNVEVTPHEENNIV